MINSIILSNKFIGKEELIKFLNNINYNYEFGHNDEDIWVINGDKILLKIEVNCLNDKEKSKIDIENLRQLEESKYELPIENPYCFSVEHNDVEALYQLLREVYKYDNNAYVTHETKDKYYKISKIIK